MSDQIRISDWPCFGQYLSTEKSIIYKIKFGQSARNKGSQKSEFGHSLPTLVELLKNRIKNFVVKLMEQHF